MTVLVIAPHLDDAVLSMPATLAATADGGERVVVATLFSEGGQRQFQRREEDLRATARLGVEALHVGLLDAPERLGLSLTYSALVQAALPGESAEVAATGRVVAALAASLDARVTWLPLGVGEHVDHRVAHAAHRAVGGDVRFYEDRPYACVPHAVRARLARLGAVVDGVAAAVSPADREALVSAGRRAPHMEAWVPAADRAAALAGLCDPRPLPSGPRLVLAAERRRFEAPRLSQACAAVRCYGSQLAPLFGELALEGVLAPHGAPFEERSYRRLGRGRLAARAPRR